MRFLLAAALLLPFTASAAEYKCVSSGRIEKGGSTWGAYAAAGSDWRIEKSSSTIGYAKTAGSDWRIETSGSSTIGYLKGDRLESSGSSTIGTKADAVKFADDCPVEIAAALWILNREGKL